jgi:hypothetical protein
VYLHLADGHTAVYGHLSRFAPKLDAYVAQRQDSAGIYEQDLYPARGEVSFKQGEVVAWSGQSGAGPPHLHFELRQGDMNLNPLLHGFALPDHTPPTLAAVKIEQDGVRGRALSLPAKGSARAEVRGSVQAAGVDLGSRRRPAEQARDLSIGGEARRQARVPLRDRLRVVGLRDRGRARVRLRVDARRLRHVAHARIASELWQRGDPPRAARVGARARPAPVRVQRTR